MKITETKITIPSTEMGPVVAFAGITIDECFAVHNLRILKGENGLFVVMPSSKTNNGYRDICHPINKETREMITKAVLEAYEEEAAKKEAE